MDDKSMKTVVVIPVRMASTRFPGKPLVDIYGLPMVEHVRRRALMSTSVDEVVVATCDQQIMDTVTQFGGKVIITAVTHEDCTGRVAEAVETLDADIVVNVQGDEPMIRPEMIDLLVAPLHLDYELSCSNLMCEIKTDEEYHNHDVVKTVVDLESNAVYFSRASIPSGHKASCQEFPKYKQLGLIAFKRQFLHEYTAMEKGNLEQIESVDMLRIIEHGHKIRMVESPYMTIGVDTPSDLESVKKIIKKDPYFEKYIDE